MGKQYILFIHSYYHTTQSQTENINAFSSECMLYYCNNILIVITFLILASKDAIIIQIYESTCMLHHYSFNITIHYIGRFVLNHEQRHNWHFSQIMCFVYSLHVKKGSSDTCRPCRCRSTLTFVSAQSDLRTTLTCIL